MLRYLALCLLLCTPVFAEDPAPAPTPPPKPVLVFPSVPTPAVVDPTPMPSPVVPVSSVPLLIPGQLFVVQSDVEFFLLASPAPLAAITYESGPIKIRGTFTDGLGKVETRTFGMRYVAIVDPSVGASGRVELLGIPAAVASEADIVRQLVDIGVAPLPPPPPPGPGPDPTPAPTGFRVLFIYETTAKLSREQLNILHSTTITKYLNEKCAKGADGRAEWRKWDQHVEIRPGESKTMTELWNAIDKTKIVDQLPQIVIVVNGAAQTFPLPATEADTLALLKKLGGE